MRNSDVQCTFADHRSAERVAAVSARFDAQLHRPASPTLASRSGASGRIEQPCELAPAVVRRLVGFRPS